MAKMTEWKDPELSSLTNRPKSQQSAEQLLMEKDWNLPEKIFYN